MIVFCSDIFKEIYAGGAELTTEAIIQDSLLPVGKVFCSLLNLKTIEKHKDNFWVFSNFSGLSDEALFYIAKNIKYATLEYDYKYCKHRLPGLHKQIEKKECDCHNSRRGKIVSIFLKNAQATFWMSHRQKDFYQEKFPFLQNHNNIVLSSVFSRKSLKFFKDYQNNPKEKNNKWIITGNPSWVKGLQDSIKYAEENNLDYEIVNGLPYDKMLDKLAESKGIIFLPRGKDTCPRFVIEAALLGCETKLNENVQHKGEEWFRSPKDILDYMEKRTNVFWKECQKYIPNIPKVENKNEKTHFKIIVPFYNTKDWIQKCVNSVKLQNYENFTCYLVDDMSTDNTVDLAKEIIGDDSRFRIIRNKEKKYALGNIHDTIEHFEAKDNDVIILLDGDDWLSCYDVLPKLNEVYETNDCTMTYGSYIIHPYGIRGVEPSEYPKEVIENNTFREDKWRASHLRTFKHLLWKKLDKNDLKYEDGNFYRMTYDQAIMLPLLEMSGKKAKYIDHIMHVYNKQNPLNIDKNKAEEQYNLALKIRKKKKYKRL